MANHKGYSECPHSPYYVPKEKRSVKNDTNTLENHLENNVGNRLEHRNYENRGGRENVRGRGHGPIRSHRGGHRTHPYRGGNRTWTKTSAKEAKITGKNIININKTNKNSFIADSGATEHIVGKGLILQKFQKIENKFIKFANKNRKADIEIYGKENLVLKTDKNNEIIELTNVIVAKDISNNLLSLRKFADIGLSIYLDKKILKIYDKDTGQIYLTEKYAKPE